MRVVVLGASGVIGRALVPRLAEAHEVIAVSRSPRPANGAVTWVTADATRAETLPRVLAGAEVAYYLVHSLGSTAFEEIDRRAAENVANAAERSGLRQIVYLGGLGDGDPDLSPHLRSRRETAARLASGRVPVTTLRAAMVVGRDSAAFETIRALVDRLPAMLCPRWVSTPTQPIALADATRYLAEVAGRGVTLGETYDIGGPEVMTYREMIERIGAVRGRRPLVVEVPVLTPWLSSWWLHLVTPVRASVARPLIEGLRSPTVARDERILELVPFERTPVDEAVREALEQPL